LALRASFYCLASRRLGRPIGLWRCARKPALFLFLGGHEAAAAIHFAMRSTSGMDCFVAFFPRNDELDLDEFGYATTL
jgi:hypothetical protein